MLPARRQQLMRHWQRAQGLAQVPPFGEDSSRAQLGMHLAPPHPSAGSPSRFPSRHFSSTCRALPRPAALSEALDQSQAQKVSRKEAVVWHQAAAAEQSA